MVLLFSEWWKTLGFIKQTCWLAAVVFSLLLFILLIMGLFEEESESSTASQKRSYPVFSSRSFLTFFSIFSWTVLMGLYVSLSYFISILLAVITASFGVWGVLRLTREANPRAINRSENYREGIGRVLNPIPSHRNGFGKVKLDYDGKGRSIEAMTAGTELKPGERVRVVEIIEGRILVVEPFRKNKQYPHEAE
jgi:membrane protein implicated in regulation of membrane protease activity